MRNKFMPGPWVSVDDGHEVHDRECSFDESGARTGDTPNEIAKVFGLNDEQRSSNAHLIAAAPDMYAALQSIIEWWEDENFHGNDQQRMLMMANAARAAIRIADGES